MNVGDTIYCIRSHQGNAFIFSDIVRKITKSGRLICKFGLYNGLKTERVNQFNQMYSKDLEAFEMVCKSKDIETFKRRYKKATGEEIKLISDRSEAKKGKNNIVHNDSAVSSVCHSLSDGIY